MSIIKNLYIIAIFCIASCFPAIANAAIDMASSAGMVAHKAIYDISLSSKKSSSNISNINGKMFYEWQPSCDAWVSTHRFNMIYEYYEMPAMRINSEFSTYESFDGKSFDFTVQRKNNNVILEEVRGRAKSDNNKIIYSLPDNLTFNLPKNTLFPTAHSIAVLNQIKNNQKIYHQTLFDGSDAEGPVDVNSFIIGKATYNPPEEYKKYIDKPLMNSQGWKVRLAFFNLNDSEIKSDYEMSAVFHENGVISSMNIDYDDFSITQKLLAIEPLSSNCSPENTNKIKKSN